ncbi:Hypothetical predicted protein [Pelobates cultripes]|uniref:Uncharacterized protein n=1 Tax=Pelobates cultripes TaxID=61616 RepID=A0AAD1S1G1_PELCU|nr:Hypothetical predicted protein [Pelobates cultripes]
MDSTVPVMDGAINLPPCKRATSRAKSTRLWKRAKAQLNSECEFSDIEEKFPEFYMEPGRKASYKAKHSSKTIEMDSSIPVKDGAINLPPRKSATSRAKSTRLWKRAKAQLNSESELSDIEEEFPESYMEDSEDISDPDYEITDEEAAIPVWDIRRVKPTKI